ncbi:hypothetical protein F0562_004209 [Nyssa sinensis]|uniref:non-specific serine/threonine protein kinase n=1 Tax=Nyssa sinensis TaxID=561372 RepID=A0A5J5C0S6_9ASTE|nr:hypothetical protein F0562_004209 [Nyssa sinensis]
MPLSRSSTLSFPPIVAALLFILFTTSSSQDVSYSNCNRTFSCGSLHNITYPFTGGDRPDYCGPPDFRLNCRDNYTELTANSITYRVLQINQSEKTLTLARLDLWNNICPQTFVNSTLNSTIFNTDVGNVDLTLIYGCSSVMNYTPQNLFSCNVSGVNSTDAFYLTGPVPSDPIMSFIECHVSIVTPVLGDAGVRLTSNRSTLEEVLMQGFNVNYSDPYDNQCSQCIESGGQCGFDSSSGQAVCICVDRPCPASPPASSPVGIPAAGNGVVRNNVPLTVGLGIAGAAVFGIGLGWCIFSCRQRRKRLAAQTVSKDLPTPPSSKGLSLTTPRTNFSQSIPSYPSLSSKNSDLEKGSTYFGVQVFSYTELEEATDNFNPSRELGDGGFGTVYFGKLHDDRIVAVKRLYENNFKRVEQFMNEVEILTRLRHPNLVTLYGCTSKRSRELLLVYEYIPNGTVADHLHGKRANSGLLSWPVRLSIAIETADALAFLHASDVIHRDVKTNNILLENDFRVKVADFGLSHKSDVYSFGVVLIELISSKQAVDTNRHRHDINLANMAVNKIQNHTLHELVDPTLGFETNSSVRRMTTLVAELAFRCLQQEKDVRPSMEEVLKALKEIKNEESSVQKAEVVDIMADDVGLLKVTSPPMSPDSAGTEKWVSSSTTPNSSG